MGSLDDLPERHESHVIAEAAESAFHAAIAALKLFVVQGKDNDDYGTDRQIEAIDGKSMTNHRVHVQLKGTEAPAKKNGSVSISVARTNLSYLLGQPDSIYVCWHIPTSRLLACYAQDVFRQYEHRGSNWQKLKEITVSFREPFDETFQRRLHARVLAIGKSTKDRRLGWHSSPPEDFPAMVQREVPLVEVPPDPKAAADVLQKLYDHGQDAAISQSFARFDAVLKEVPNGMLPAYMAEINLGINKSPFDRDRVRRAVDLIQETSDRKQIAPISALYCQGNAWLALGEYEKAGASFVLALKTNQDERHSHIAAQCFKNLGTVAETLGHHKEALSYFDLALKCDPYLAEAHMALAICGLKDGKDPKDALAHLDAITAHRGSALSIPSVQGWRIEILFQLGDEKAAFREIQSLLGVASEYEWIWPCCAWQVAQYGRGSVDSARQAISFWRAYLVAHPTDVKAQRERLLCFSHLNFNGVKTEMTFEEFRGAVEKITEQDVADPAFLWDRVGHWAQNDHDWQQAEEAFRKAYDLEGGHYGYCLGTALNALSRYAEALPLVVEQANELQPDAMSWFQVAIAREGTGDFEGCVAAYERAIELDPNYELAWFNLGGLYLNRRNVEKARATWQEAIKRFPESDQAKRILRDCAKLFEDKKRS